MTVQLILMRHSTAEEVAAGGRDADRALTSEGVSRARALGTLLHSLGLLVPTVYSSPLRRAVQTAEQISSVCQGGAVLTESTLGPNHDLFEGIRGVVERASAEAQKIVLVVSHQPQVGEVIQALLGISLSADISPATACVLSIDSYRRGAARLELFIDGALVWG